MINVIKASAGSGKTYQLTYEYIKLLLGVKRKGHYELAHENERERHRHILAVTFTNKATGEMKERIVKELSVLAGKIPGKTSPYMKDLCRDFGNVNPEEVKKASYKALVDLLFDYTNFNVSTIDSFFQMILRTFAKELKMSYNYDVELDEDYAIKVGVNDFLSSLAHDKGVLPDSGESKRVRRAKSWIKEFVREEVANKKSWNIFLDSEAPKVSGKKFARTFSFNTFATSLNKEELRLHIDDIMEYLGYDDSEGDVDRISRFKEGLYSLIKRMKSGALDAVKNIVNYCESKGFTLEQLNSRGGLQWILKVIEDGDHYKPGTMDTEKILGTKDRSETWFKKGKSKNAPTPDEDMISRVCKYIDEFAECNSRYLIYKEIHRSVFMLGLLGEINRYLSKFRKENDLILLADTNELLHRIINNEDTPFVYERVGIWLSHFLIDEFQDTSRAQWDNMKPLLFNSCAEGSDNLIIGDEKQCIYRFRNADPTLLRTEVGHHFTVKQNDSGKCINWRSAPNVVNFNNEFFTRIATMQGCAEEYSNVQQELPPGKEYANEGYVEVNFIETNNKDKSDDAKVKFDDVVLERLPSLIKDIVSRGYRYSDIAVLTVTNGDGADVIQRILDYNKNREDNESAINVISNESLMLKSSSAVRLIISHLRYLDTKMIEVSGEGENASSEANDMEGYVHRLLRNYESLMFKQGMMPGDALEESFSTVSRSAPTTELSLATLLPENTESFNIVSITEHIIAQNITEEDLVNENAFIQAFQDSVVDFSNRQNATIHEFLRWWDRGGCNISINSPGGQNAINVLTIHKSKGLEYKCVIIPFCDWDLSGKDEVLWIPKEQLLNSGLLCDMDSGLVPPLIPLWPQKDMDLSGNGLGDFYDGTLKERIIDTLNMTYVGFTRAVDELYVFTPEENGSSPTKMCNLLSTLPVPEGGNQYVAGTKGNVQSVEDDAEEDSSLKMPLYKVEDNKLEYVVPDLFCDEQRKKGTRLHNVFKRIRYKDDVDTALLYFKVKGLIPREQFDEDSLVVKEALEDVRVQEWFDRGNRVYNERSLVKLFKKSRPDRFVTTPDGRTIVIDYKFGEVHSATYRKQVKEYMDTLAEVGFNNIEGYLWYPLEQKIEQIK